MPATSRPRKRPRSISRSASRCEQPNLRLSGQSASLEFDQHADDHPRARRVLGDLADLRFGVGRELLDPDGMGIGDVGRALDGIAERDMRRGNAQAEAEVDLAARGRVEMRPLGGEGCDNLGGGVRLDGIVDGGVAQALGQRIVFRAQHVEVEDHGRRVEVMAADIGILRRAHGADGGVLVDLVYGNAPKGGGVQHGHLHQTRGS